MGLGVTLLFLLTILTIILGIKVASNGIGAKSRASFCLFMLNIFFFCLGRIGDFALRDGATDGVGALADCALAFMPATSCWVLFCLLNFGTYRQRRNVLGGSVLGGLLFSLLVFTPVGGFSALYVVGWLAGLAVLFWVLYLLRQHCELINNQTEGICFFYGSGMFLAAVSLLLLCLPVGDIVSSLAAIVLGLFCYTLCYGANESKLVDLRRDLTGVGVVATLALIISLLYALFMIWGGVAFGNWFFYGLLASLVMVLGFEHFRPWLEDRLNNWLHPQLMTCREQLSAVIEDMAEAEELDQFGRALISGIAGTQLARQGAFYIEDGRRNFVRVFASSVAYPQHLNDDNAQALFNDLVERQHPVVASNIEKRLELLALHTADDRQAKVESAEQATLLAALRDLDVDTVIPILTDELLRGLLVIKNKDYQYTYAEMLLLKEFGHQCGDLLEKQTINSQKRLSLAVKVMASYLEKAAADPVREADRQQTCNINSVIREISAKEVPLSLSSTMPSSQIGGKRAAELVDDLLSAVPQNLQISVLAVSTAYANDYNIMQVEYGVPTGIEVSDLSILPQIARSLPDLVRNGAVLACEQLPTKLILRCKFLRVGDFPVKCQ